MVSDSEMKAVGEALQNASRVPVYDSAQILSGPDAATVELLLNHSIRDLKKDTKRRVSTFTSFKTGPSGVIGDDALTQYSVEEKDEVTMSKAHDYVNGERVVFRSCEAEKDGKEKRLFVERWSKSGMLQSIEVTTHHGAFNADVMFGRVSFHRTRHSRIAYIAEAKKPKASSPEKYSYEDDWGEKLGGIVNPIIVILDFEGGHREYSPENPDVIDPDAVSTDNLIIASAPQGGVCGEVTFAPEDGMITYTCTYTDPHRYGLYYCFNRRSHIAHTSYSGDSFSLQRAEHEHVRSPCYSDDGYLYFLSNPSSGPHFQCSSLYGANFSNTSQTKSLIPVIQDPRDHVPKYDLSFHGIYTDRLVYVDNERIVFNTQSRNTLQAMIAYKSPEDGSIMGINPLAPDPDPERSWSVIGAGKGQAVLASHAPDGAVELKHLSLTDGRMTTFHTRSSPFPDLFRSTIVPLPERSPVCSIMHQPSAASDTPLNPSTDASVKPPLVVMPHGGPHTAYSTTYSAYTAALLHLGAAVLQVNYTGSTGFGTRSLEDLVGSIGERDVDDVHAAVQQQISKGRIDPDRICVMGGSHGGFIGAWLLGKYPDTYKAGILLNPVINLATVGAGSDIPDWAISESIAANPSMEGQAGSPQEQPYNLRHPPVPSASTYKTLLSKSPITVVGNVKSPVCMILGGKDRRVPSYEGKNYITSLKSADFYRSRHKCYIFPEEGHSLDGGEAYRGVWEVIGHFLMEHMSLKT